MTDEEQEEFFSQEMKKEPEDRHPDSFMMMMNAGLKLSGLEVVGNQIKKIKKK